MGHGKMGWLNEDPEKFFSVAAERNKAVIAEVRAPSVYLNPKP